LLKDGSDEGHDEFDEAVDADKLLFKTVPRLLFPAERFDALDMHENMNNAAKRRPHGRR
jgi:hypothetical protein